MSDPSRAPFNIIYLLLGGLLLVIAVAKFRAFRRNRYPGLAVMGVAFAVIAAALVLAAPVVALALASATGITHLSTLIVYSAVTVFAACLVALSLMWTPPHQRAPGTSAWASSDAASRWREVRRKVVAVYGPLLVVLAALFVAFAPSEGRDKPFDTSFTHIPGVLAYLLLYQAGFSWALVMLGRMAARRAAVMPHEHRATRTSLRLTTVACAVAGGYTVCKVASIVSAAAGTDVLLGIGTVVGPLCACAGAVLLAAAWGNAALGSWRQRRDDYRTLYPLWARALAVDGKLALDTAQRGLAEQLAARDLEWRITRRTREIRDAQLTLARWVRPEALKEAAQRATAAGLSGPEHDAAVAALAFLAALKGRDEKQPAASQSIAVPGVHIAPELERAHLVAMARHLSGPLAQQPLETST
ncbi:DUF6545 domain-containing protein [Streptomyces sp. ODS28]|uniref:DUF6545 domain-containing protein n=1 Tax=Streptomyces sp. ODS28 TaxID=3136688 RepID=UPI0031ECF3E0